MRMLMYDNPVALWRQTVQEAEGHCAVTLKKELETYLITLLDQYTHKPELVKQIFAVTFLEAQANHDELALQKTGDQCLLFTGLFPHAVEKRLVTMSYFVQLGQLSYLSLAEHIHDDFFTALANEFVTLMDVLQSIRMDHELLPLEAYEQWHELGSKRALKILQSYTQNR